MSSLIIEIDGVNVGKLGNGKVFSTKVDEQSHELHIHGGFWQARRLHQS